MANYEYDTWEHPFAPYAAGWCRLIGRGLEFKDEEFQQDADDIKKFFNGTKGDFWGKSAGTDRGFYKPDSDIPQPDFQMILMKVAEACQIIGPSLYSTDPVIEVDPLQHPVLPPEAFGITPSMQRQVQQVMSQPVPEGMPPPQPPPFIQQYEAYLESTQMREITRKAASAVLSTLLNYNQKEFGAKTHARAQIDDALLTGMGIRVTEVESPPMSKRKYVCSKWHPIERLVLDPDAQTDEEVMWSAIGWTMPYWQAEEKWGLDKDELKEYANNESVFSQEFNTNKYLRATGKSNDLLSGWYLYSKMGIGEDIPGLNKEDRHKLPVDLGKYVYAAVSPKVPFFLNCPSSKLKKIDEDEVFMRFQWPIPFYADGKANGWPWTPMTFHKVPGHVWPMSHFKPGMGELKWLTWAMSFLANKVRTSCGTTIAVMAAAGEDLKKQLEANVDNKLIELREIVGTNINNVVSYLQQPPFHGDIWKVVEAVFELWDKRIGLSELMYGMSETQDRSATETATKQENVSARVSDMRAQVEDATTMVARKEVIAIRWLLTPEDVGYVLGPEATQIFQDQIMTADLEQLVREYEYGIVAGSTRLQDRQVKINNLNQFMASFGPILQQVVGMGITEPINAVMQAWGKLWSTDVEEWQINIPPPPPAPPDPKAELEAQKIQAELQKMQLDAQLSQQEQAAEMAFKERELEMRQMEMAQKLEFEEEKGRMELLLMERKAMLEIELERERAAAELELMKAEAYAKMQLSAQESSQEVQLKKDEAAANLEISEVEAAGKMQVEQQKASSDQAIAKQKADSDAKAQAAKTKADISAAKEKSKVENEATRERVKIEAKKASKPKPKKG